MIGQMNIVLTFCPYTLNDTATGGTERIAGTCYTDWCKVEQLSGSHLEQAQITFSKSYKITKRHYPSREVEPGLTEIEYGSTAINTRC